MFSFMKPCNFFSSVFWKQLYYPCMIPQHHYPERVSSQQYGLFILQKLQVYFKLSLCITLSLRIIFLGDQMNNGIFTLSHFLLYHLHEAITGCILDILGLILPVLHSNLSYRPTKKRQQLTSQFLKPRNNSFQVLDTNYYCRFAVG